jgi:DNA-directed RNA polymerase specialized sigma24 family protein
MSHAPATIDARVLPDLLMRYARDMRVFVQNRIPAAFQSLICADDILQDTWIAAYRRVSEFRDVG